NVIVALITGAFVMAFAYWSAKRTVMRMPTSTNGVLGEHTITLSPEGVLERTAVNEGLHKWSGIHAIVDDKEHLYLMIGEQMSHIIPKRAFASESEALAFADAAKAYRSTAGH